MSTEQDAYIGAEIFREQRDWLIEKCGEIGVTVNVLIGAPLEFVQGNSVLAWSCGKRGD
jgi:hypothetical protein